MKRDFNVLIDNLKETISSYDYYTEFDKVLKNVEKYEKEIMLFNNLLGKENIEKEFKDLTSKNFSVLKVLPMFLAIRKPKIFSFDEKVKYFDFKNLNRKIEEYAEFAKKTGLLDFLKNSRILNIRDYLLGVEVGLDSNARKNRTWHANGKVSWKVH